MPTRRNFIFLAAAPSCLAPPRPGPAPTTKNPRPAHSNTPATQPPHQHPTPNNQPGHTGSVEAAGFCPSGQAPLAASAGLDAFLRVWDAGAGFAPRAAVEHPAGVTRLAWHPQQPAVVATACLDGRVRLCDLRTGAVVRKLSGHEGPVQDVAFSPDGRHVLSGSDDGTARVFSAV
jgi:WD40 repeat protein